MLVEKGFFYDINFQTDDRFFKLFLELDTINFNFDTELALAIVK